jgi:hypothetical protein
MHVVNTLLRFYIYFKVFFMLIKLAFQDFLDEREMMNLSEEIVKGYSLF